MRAYSVREQPDAEWHVVVIANNSREAKAMGYDYITSYFDGDLFTNCRVSWLKDIIVPDNNYSSGTVFEGCESDWMCQCWTGCEDTMCPNYANRRILPGEEEGW